VVAAYLGGPDDAAAPVLFDVTLHVDAGEIVALLGPNGAGKTTTLRAIAGLLPLATGTITLAGTPLAGRSPEQLARLGICTIPER
jgi:branched-chain amino acid transport system ATP-binding protein